MQRRDPLADPEPLIRRVYAYVAYRIGDGPEAEDVTNDTFERALRRRETYDPERGTPGAWLIGIARRCVADAVANRPPTVPDVPDLPGEGSLEAATVRRLGLGAAIVMLDEHEQDLIALRYGADLTAKRIAEVLGLQTNAVEVALHRTLARLRGLLEAQDVPAPTELTGEQIAAGL